MKSIGIKLLILLFILSCGKTEVEKVETKTNSAQSESMLKTFYKSMNKLRVEVFYEEGSEPYTGTSLLGKDYWDLFDKNIREILQVDTRSIDIFIPNELSEMASFTDKSKESWSVSELQNLFSEVGASASTSDTAYLSIIFLSGAFRESSGEVNRNTLGIHITGTTRIVIFKDLLKAIESSDGKWVSRYSEQSVLVHEVGHAIGMVNNGLPMSTEHHDSEHGDHCTNDKCVMFWLNEGKEGLKDFIHQYISTGSEIIWGDQCLQDAKSY